MAEFERVKVKLSSTLGQKAPIFLADFSCGQLKENSKIKFECFRADSGTDEVSAKRKLIASTGHLTHEGSFGEGKGESTQKVPKYFVGVRNKNTGKMKLYDSMFFRMKPKLEDSPATFTINTSAENNYWGEVNKLTEAFGSKGKKRMLSSRIKLDINESSIEDSLKNNSFDSTSLLPDSQTESSQLPYLPIVNRKAESLDEVFDLSDIIWPEEDLALQELVNNWIQDYSSKSDNAMENFCSFAKQYVDRVGENYTKLKYLLYYNYLVIFQNLSYADVRKKDPSPLIPEPIKDSLLKKFTMLSKLESGRVSRVMPPQQKAKLLAHILIVALHILDYNVNINHILADLKRGTTKQFNSIAETMGCYVKSCSIDGEPSKLAELKLPLNYIPPKYSKRQF